MDLIFQCSNCDQEMAVDSVAAGSEIQCPACNQTLTVPEAIPQNVQTLNPIAASAAAKEERHFSVPSHDEPTEALIKKPLAPLEVAAKDGDKKIRVRTIKHGDCIEVGKDKFDDVLTDFLGKIGEANIVSITPIIYSHTDIATRQMCTDFAVMIVFRG